MTTSRRIVLLLSSELLTAVLGWLAIKLILLKMGKGALGELAFALSLVGSLSFIGLLGFRQAHIKRVSEGRDLGRCVGAFISIRMVLLSIMVLVVLGLLGVWLLILGKPLTDVSLHMILLILAYYLIFYVNGIPSATFTARLETAKATIPTLVGNLVRLSLMCIVAFFSVGVIFLGYAYLVGILVTLLISIILFRQYPVKKAARDDYLSYYRYSRPLMLVMIVSTAANYIDKVVLGIFSNARELGAFYAIQRLVLILFAIVTSVEAILFPQLSALHAKKNSPGELKARIHEVERWLLIITFPLVIVFLALPEPTIMVLLSASIADADGYLVLRLLALTMLMRVVMRPYRIVLRAVDRPDLAARVGLISGLGAILLTCLLVPGKLPPYLGAHELGGLGARGAAWALLISAFAGLVLAQMETHRILRFHSSFRSLCFIYAGIIDLILIHQLSQWVDVEGWFRFSAFAMLAVGVFWGLLALMRQFTLNDIQTVWEAIHPGQMGRYMRDELKG